MIGELFCSVSSVYTHSDDAWKMRRGAELLQSLLSLIDDLESEPRAGMVGAQGSGLPQTEGSIPSPPANRRTNVRKQ